MRFIIRKVGLVFLSLLGIVAAAVSSPASVRSTVSSMPLVASSLPAVLQTTASTYDVRIFGAIGDGKTLNTKALQAAIDKCNAAGGGTVLVAGGRYVTGTLYLKSNVSLRVESGATIVGSTSIDDYTTDTDRTMYRGEPYMD